MHVYETYEDNKQVCKCKALFKISGLGITTNSDNIDSTEITRPCPNGNAPKTLNWCTKNLSIGTSAVVWRSLQNCITNE